MRGEVYIKNSRSSTPGGLERGTSVAKLLARLYEEP